MVTQMYEYQHLLKLTVVLKYLNSLEVGVACYVKNENQKTQYLIFQKIEYQTVYEKWL